MTGPQSDSAEQLAAIVASSDDAIVSKDLDGVITSWNGAAERMFGYSAAEAIGQSIYLIIPDDRRAEEAEVLARVRRGEMVAHFDTVRRRKDGTLVPVSLTVSPVRSATGTIIGASKIARDVSERLRAQSALLHAEAAQAELQRKLLALVAASQTLLVSPRVEDVMPAALRLATEVVAADGYAVWRQQAASGSWRVGVHQGISDEFASATIEPRQTATRIEWPLIVPDVSAAEVLGARQRDYEREGIRSVLAVPLSIRGEFSGSITFYFRTRHSFTDVEIQTASALANLVSAAITTAELYDAQRRSVVQSEFLAETGAVLAASLDSRQAMRQVTLLAVPHLADWCAVELVNDTGGLERVSVAHKDPARVAVAEAFLAKYPSDPASTFTAEYVVRTGAPVLVEHLSDQMLAAGARSPDHLAAVRELGITSFMCVPLVARGRTLGALTFVAAESGRRYTAQDLQFAQDVAYRAGLALENARAYEEARHANQLKDDFLATLSHELRTPLNAILGYAHMLHNGILDETRQRRAVEIIERNASSLARIVADVLDVSRIVSGKLQLKVEPVDFSRIIADAADTIMPAADAKNLTVTTDVAVDGARVSGDPARLQQVVWNLLSNAVKFTPAGGQITVSAGPSNGHVELVVADTGSGITPEFLPFVFERFRQADSRFSREYSGLGLGLAITRHLVELHGGTVRAESAGPGSGSTFLVRLPLAADAPAATELPGQAVEPGKKEGGRLDGLQVLIVDDEEDALSIMQDLLEAAGARVITAMSAGQALDILDNARPDVLIADIGMPRMDGLEFIARVRQRPQFRGLPAAAVTAYARVEDRVRALDAGFQLHLPKPIEPEELIGVVAHLAGR